MDGNEGVIAMIAETTIAVLVIGTTQIIKPLFKEKKLHAPLALIIGICYGLVFWPINGTPETIISGLLAALIASGVYDNVKAILENTR